MLDGSFQGEFLFYFYKIRTTNHQQGIASKLPLSAS